MLTQSAHGQHNKPLDPAVGHAFAWFKGVLQLSADTVWCVIACNTFLQERRTPSASWTGWTLVGPLHLVQAAARVAQVA
jgi:hypothetical protein